MPSNEALDLIAPHCDIVERLRWVPPAARVRGVHFRAVESEIRKANLAPRWGELFPDDRWSSMRLYPLASFLVRLACAGALVASPENIHRGMYEVMRSNATAVAGSLLGKSMLRLLARDPVRLTEQGLAARRLTNLYGHWEIARHGPRCIEMIYRDALHVARSFEFAADKSKYLID